MTVYMKYIMSKTLKSSQPRRASWDRLRILELLIDSNDRRFDEKLVVDAHSADHQEKADHVKSTLVHGSTEFITTAKKVFGPD